MNKLQSAQLSFDYMVRNPEALDSSFNRHSHHSAPDLTWLDHSEDIMSILKEEELDEIEQYTSPRRHPYDFEMREFGSNGQRLNEEYDVETQSRHWEDESNSSMVIVDTDKNTVEMSQEEHVPSDIHQEQNSSLEEEFVNNGKMLYDSLASESQPHIHIENTSSKTVHILADDLSPPMKNEVVVGVQRSKRKRGVSSRCGFLRFLTCSKNLEQIDNHF
eukprot:g3249.t1